MSTTEHLVAELEEVLWAEAWLPLHFFSWAARGLDKSLTDDEIETAAREAYDVFTRRFHLCLVWSSWPPGGGEPAAPGTPLNFDTYRDTDEVDLPFPFLALVPDDPDAVGDELERQFFPDGRPEPPKKRWWSR